MSFVCRMNDFSDEYKLTDSENCYTKCMTLSDCSTNCV